MPLKDLEKKKDKKFRCKNCEIWFDLKRKLLNELSGEDVKNNNFLKDAKFLPKFELLDYIFIVIILENRINRLIGVEENSIKVSNLIETTSKILKNIPLKLQNIYLLKM